MERTRCFWAQALLTGTGTEAQSHTSHQPEKGLKKGWQGSGITNNKPFFKSEGVARREIRGLNIKLRAEPHEAGREDFCEQLVQSRRAINAKMFISIGRKKRAAGSVAVRCVWEGCSRAEHSREAERTSCISDQQGSARGGSHPSTARGLEDPSQITAPT